MKTVWKAVITPNSSRDRVYPIKVAAKIGAVPLTVMKQGDDVCLWFEVDTDESPKVLTVYCVGTGFGKVPDNGTYFATVIDGDFVWHFYH